MSKCKKEWLTKSQRRAQQKKDHGVVDIMRITFHFFKKINSWIHDCFEDPRNEGYITYPQEVYIMMGLMKNICGQTSMTEMEQNFNEEECIKTLAYMSGHKELKEMPHKDSLNYYLERLSDDNLSKLRTKMIRTLLRANRFNDARINNKYWRIIIDGTGLHYYKEKPDDNALRTKIKHDDGTEEYVYYHKVLEAKLVLGDHLVVSIDTEFIENESEDVSKQDCETNAAKRLAKRLKEQYSRMNICIQGDALYSTRPFMEICKENHWAYIFTLKSGNQEKLVDMFKKKKSLWACEYISDVGEEGGCCYYLNDIEEVFPDENVSGTIFEYVYQTEEGKDKHFRWITSFSLNTFNVSRMIGYGRMRWKIENEGFNFQKNVLYDIQHINSYEPQAMKNHYLLTQIADIIMRLYLAWTPLMKNGLTSIKNTSSRILESFRTHSITPEDVSYIRDRTSIYLLC